MRLFSSFLVLMFFCLISCSVDDFSEVRLYSEDGRLHTKAGAIIDSTLLVSVDEAVVYAKTMAGDSSRELVRVRPVFYDEFPTSYIIEYSDGWTIISADKRGPIVLAVSEKDGAYDDEMPEGAFEWINMLNSEIAERWSKQSLVNYDFEPERLSISFWKSLTDANSFFETKIADPNMPIGHLELLTEESHQEVYDSIPHLTNTLWSQGYPYNKACPFKRGSTSYRVPAGCGAIATSQFLYYLHYYWGSPELAPSSAECVGDIDNYVFNIPSPSSYSVWEAMNSSYPSSDMSYILVADMADKLNTVYTDSTGTSSFWDFQDALQSYGVYSSYTGNLVADTLRVNLLNGLPIIMRGARITPSGESGHFFLVDGYVRYRIVTTSVYVMVWDPPRPINLDGDFIEINYSTPTIELVKMNWGWGDCSHKDDSYSPYGTWEAADGYVYDRGYKMLSGYYLDD